MPRGRCLHALREWPPLLARSWPHHLALRRQVLEDLLTSSGLIFAIIPEGIKV